MKKCLEYPHSLLEPISFYAARAQGKMKKCLEYPHSLLEPNSNNHHLRLQSEKTKLHVNGQTCDTDSCFYTAFTGTPPVGAIGIVITFPITASFAAPSTRVRSVGTGGIGMKMGWPRFSR